MGERGERVAKRFEIPVLVAALLVVPVIAIEQSSLGEPWTYVAAWLNWAIWLVFAAELAAILAVVTQRGRWLRDHPLEVAIVVLTPPFLPASLQALRAFRLLRLLRLLRLAPLARRLFSLQGLRYASVLAALTVLGGGAAFAAAETGRSTWDGVYWAVTTMTTVGYGEITPQTTLGRVIAMVVMVLGIGFLTIVIGAVSERFVSIEMREEVAEAEAEIEEEIEEVEAGLLFELREITARLHELEANVEQLVRRARP